MRAFVFLLLYFCSANVFSQNSNALTIDELTKELSLQNFVGGDFNQVRTIKGFSKEVLSSGRFYFWRNQGLYWEINKPYFHATTYNKNKTLSWNSNGEVTADESSDVIQRHVNKVILSLFGADSSQLNKMFEAEKVERNESAWSIELSPKMKAIKNNISTISLSGQTYLKEVTIFAVSGERTQISFSNTYELETPSPDKKHLFSPL